jgi:hypothetical protein
MKLDRKKHFHYSNSLVRQLESVKTHDFKIMIH